MPEQVQYIEAEETARRDAGNGVEVWARLHRGHFTEREVDGKTRPVFVRDELLNDRLQRGFDVGATDADVRAWLEAEMANYPEMMPL